MFCSPKVAGATLAASLCCAPAVASADPVAPQADTPCAATVVEAMVLLAEAEMPLVCMNEPGDGYQWEAVPTAYPASDRWLTYGPEMTLSGEGRRNPNIRSGDWIALPQDPTSRCRAEQVAVVSAGVLGPPRIDEGETGQALSFPVLPKLVSISMSGDCLWALKEDGIG